MSYEGESVPGSTPPRFGDAPGIGERPARSPQRRQAGELLHALLAAERCLARCYEKALRCAGDPHLAAAWRNGLAAASARASALAERLRDDASVGTAPVEPDADCLVEAIELAVLNGDPDAAQAVARECLLLAQSRCAAARERWQACRRGTPGQRKPVRTDDGLAGAR